jgi:hypothetical protein
MVQRVEPKCPRAASSSAVPSLTIPHADQEATMAIAVAIDFD